MNSISDIDNPINTLTDILVREQKMLETGDVKQVSELLDLKMTAWRAFENELAGYARVKPSAQQRDSVEKVIALAKENAIRYESIRRGLQSVMERLRGETDSSYVGAYDQTGQKMSFSGASGRYQSKI